MFCATFYSYKGGVGRTLALANCAVLLAKRGMKVLVVDFDLEAPGLTTLGVFAGGRGKPGIVDYVGEYIDSGVAPDVAKYIHVSSYTDADGEDVSIDIMPASSDDAGYSKRFATIDWQNLYNNQDGFLLIEDLRVAWDDQGYDYVLIDSRTGLTDVGGICTRQLPDAVVCVFFLNEQNLVGTKQIVEGIRASGARDEKIETLFVASRVPRLDDEHGVLRGWLSRFQSHIEYDDDQLSRIEHYDSLTLLNQDLFVITRPRSGLALQYGELAKKIARLNYEDPDGSIDYVINVRRRLQRLSRLPRDGDDRYATIDYDHFDRISDAHRADFNVQSELARAYYSWRDLRRAAIASDAALSAFAAHSNLDDPAVGLALSRLHHLRMRIFSEIEDTKVVAGSAIELLAASSATETMVLDALLALVSIADSKNKIGVVDAAFLERFDRAGLLVLAQKLAASPAAASLAASIAEQAILRHSDEGLGASEKIEAQMLLIAGGRFSTAATLDSGEFSNQFPYVAISFNKAIADWAINGQPSRDLFEKVIEGSRLQSEDLLEGANYNQCLGLAYAVLGKRDLALEHINRAIEIASGTSSQFREFSCWSFQNLTNRDFIAECKAMLEFVETGAGIPTVIQSHHEDLNEPLVALN